MSRLLFMFVSMSVILRHFTYVKFILIKCVFFLLNCGFHLTCEYDTVNDY